MNITQHRRPITRLSGIGVAALLSLTLAACGGAESSSSQTAEQGTSSSAAASSPSSAASENMQTTAGEPFGEGCAAVPEDGAGSFDGMSQDPVATAASNNPALSTLVTAVSEAGLVDTLNSAEDITVFAPTNEAFEAMDPATLDAAMADPQGMLTDVLTAHVVEGRLSPDQLAGEHQSLNSEQTVTVEGSGEDFTVNGEASVVCGDVQTKNATVYIIDSVLLPQG